MAALLTEKKFLLVNEKHHANHESPGHDGVAAYEYRVPTIFTAFSSWGIPDAALLLLVGSTRCTNGSTRLGSQEYTAFNV